MKQMNLHTPLRPLIVVDKFCRAGEVAPQVRRYMSISTMNLQ